MTSSYPTAANCDSTQQRHQPMLLSAPNQQTNSINNNDFMKTAAAYSTARQSINEAISGVESIMSQLQQYAGQFCSELRHIEHGLELQSQKHLRPSAGAHHHQQKNNHHHTLLLELNEQFVSAQRRVDEAFIRFNGDMHVSAQVQLRRAWDVVDLRSPVEAAVAEAKIAHTQNQQLNRKAFAGADNNNNDNNNTGSLSAEDDAAATTTTQSGKNNTNGGDNNDNENDALSSASISAVASSIEASKLFRVGQERTLRRNIVQASTRLALRQSSMADDEECFTQLSQREHNVILVSPRTVTQFGAAQTACALLKVAQSGAWVSLGNLPDGTKLVNSATSIANSLLATDFSMTFPEFKVMEARISRKDPLSTLWPRDIQIRSSKWWSQVVQSVHHASVGCPKLTVKPQQKPENSRKKIIYTCAGFRANMDDRGSATDHVPNDRDQDQQQHHQAQRRDRQTGDDDGHQRQQQQTTPNTKNSGGNVGDTSAQRDHKHHQNPSLPSSPARVYYYSHHQDGTTTLHHDQQQQQQQNHDDDDNASSSPSSGRLPLNTSTTTTATSNINNQSITAPSASMRAFADAGMMSTEQELDWALLLDQIECKMQVENQVVAPPVASAADWPNNNNNNNSMSGVGDFGSGGGMGMPSSFPGMILSGNKNNHQQNSNNNNHANNNSEQVPMLLTMNDEDSNATCGGVQQRGDNTNTNNNNNNDAEPVPMNPNVTADGESCSQRVEFKHHRLNSVGNAIKNNKSTKRGASKNRRSSRNRAAAPNDGDDNINNKATANNAGGGHDHRQHQQQQQYPDRSEFWRDPQKVIFQMSPSVKGDDRKLAMSTVQGLGCAMNVVASYDKNATHLVASAGPPERTEKYLAFRAAGKKIVTLAYLLDSLDRGYLLKEDSYIPFKDLPQQVIVPREVVSFGSTPVLLSGNLLEQQRQQLAAAGGAANSGAKPPLPFHNWRVALFASPYVGQGIRSILEAGGCTAVAVAPFTTKVEAQSTRAAAWIDSQLHHHHHPAAAVSSMTSIDSQNNNNNNPIVLSSNDAHSPAEQQRASTTTPRALTHVLVETNNGMPESVTYVPPAFRALNITYSLELIFIILCTHPSTFASQIPTTLNSMNFKES